MADIRIHEVQTDLEITDGGGVLGPAEMKKIVAAVLERLDKDRLDKDQVEASKGKKEKVLTRK